MPDMNVSKQDEAQMRRKFLKGAAVAGAAAAGYLVNFNAPSTSGVQPAAAAGTVQKFAKGRAPFTTPIPDMLTTQAAGLLTPAASKLNKGQLLHLRNAVKGRTSPNAPQNLTAADISSIETAFDTHENAIATAMGFQHAGIEVPQSSQHAWVSFGVASAHAQSGGGISCCCTCSPCCSCAASVTAPVMVA